MNTPTPTPTRSARRQYAFRRTATATLTTLVIVLCGLLFAPPAAASILDDICPRDTSMPMPNGGAGTNGLDGVLKGYDIGDHKAAIIALPETAASPASQYSGAGMTYHAFDTGCMEWAPGMTAQAANMIVVVGAEWPLRAFGTVAQWVSGGGMIDGLLLAAGDVAAPLRNTLWGGWPAQIAIMLMCFGAIWAIASKRKTASLTLLIWMLVLSAATSAIYSPWGTKRLIALNDRTTDLTDCLMWEIAGGGCDQAHSTATWGDELLESAAAPAWATGALGEMAGQVAPATLTMDGGTVVTVPVRAIPSRTAGAPTYGEVLRWTQTYTAAELRAIEGDASLACKSPLSAADIRGLDKDTSSICAAKWTVRTALADTLRSAKPAVYQDFRSASSAPLVAAFSVGGLWVLALVLTIVAAGILTLSLGMVGLVLTGPILSIFAISDANIARQWAGRLAYLVGARAVAGTLFGATVFMTGRLVEMVTGSLTATGDGSAALAMSPIAIPSATVVTTLCVVAMMYGTWKWISPQLKKSTGAKDGDAAEQATAPVKEAAQVAGGVAVGAAVGAVTGGAGGALTGAAGGLTRRNGGAGRTALRTALSSAGRRRGQQPAPTTVTQVETQGWGGPDAPDQDDAAAEAAWAQVAEPYRPDGHRQAAERVAQVDDALHAARTAHATAQQGRGQRVRSIADGLRRSDATLTVEAAEQRAVQTVDRELAGLGREIADLEEERQRAVEALGVLNVEWEQDLEPLVRDLRSGHDATAVGARRGLDAETVRALREMLHQQAQQTYGHR